MKTKRVFVTSFSALAAAMALPAMAMNHNLLAPWAKAPVEKPLAEPVDGTESYGELPSTVTPQMRALAYFDPINFAPMSKCPAYFNGGLIDPVSPAYSTYAAYLRWGGGDKTFTAVPGHGHDWWAAFDRAAYRWLDRVLGDEKRTRGCQ